MRGMREIGTTLAELLDAPLDFILDYPIPWLSQDSDRAKVQEALRYLRRAGVSEDYTGALRVCGSDLAEFGRHLFWLIRQAGLPYCWFTAGAVPIAAGICKYGNLHGYDFAGSNRGWQSTLEGRGW